MIGKPGGGETSDDWPRGVGAAGPRSEKRKVKSENGREGGGRESGGGGEGGMTKCHERRRGTMHSPQGGKRRLLCCGVDSRNQSVCPSDRFHGGRENAFRFPDGLQGSSVCGLPVWAGHNVGRPRLPLPVSEETDAFRPDVREIQIGTGRHQLQVNKIVGPVASRFRDGVQFLRHLMGEGHHPQWFRPGKPELFERIAEFLWQVLLELGRFTVRVPLPMSRPRQPRASLSGRLPVRLPRAVPP